MRENLRHKIRTQEHVCHICGFTTMSKLHIKRHILVKHQSDKHKKCPHCDFHTAYTHGIQTHIDGNHPELYEKNFDCDHCSKRFIFTQVRNFWFFFPLALKSSLESHQMTNFFVQKRNLIEIIIIWAKNLSFWTKQVVIWWLFNVDLRTRGKRNHKFRASVCAKTSR